MLPQRHSPPVRSRLQGVASGAIDRRRPGLGSLLRTIRGKGMGTPFTATAVLDVDAPPKRVFGVATSVERLGSWLWPLENIRAVDGALRLHPDLILLADESLADGPEEVDRRFQVTVWKQDTAFAFKSMDDESFEGRLVVHGSPSGSQATWTTSSVPPGRVDRIMATLTRGSVTKQLQRQATAQLARLAQLVVDDSQ